MCNYRHENGLGVNMCTAHYHKIICWARDKTGTSVLLLFLFLFSRGLQCVYLFWEESKQVSVTHPIKPQ